MTKKEYDTISLNIGKIEPCENSEYKGYSVEVSLNGALLGNSIFNAAVSIAASKYNYAEFDLFTCSCGDPGCSGYFTQIKQEKKAEYVEWIFPKDEAYKLEKYQYEFCRKQFEEEFLKIEVEMLALEKINTYNYASLRDLASYVGFELDKNGQYEVKEMLEDEIDWHENRFAGEENFQKVVQENFPNLYDKEVYYLYDDKESYKISFDVLIRRGLNQWPSKKKEKIYLKQVIKMGKVIEESLKDSDTKKLNKKIYNSYKKAYGSQESKPSLNTIIWWALDYDLSQIAQEEGFEAKKLKLMLA